MPSLKSQTNLRLLPVCLLLAINTGLVTKLSAQQPITTAVSNNSAVSSPAQNTYNDELITINIHEAEIISVIQWMAEKTHKKILINPSVKGKVSILANVPMSIDDAYLVFLTMLDVYGFTSTEYNDVVSITTKNDSYRTASHIIKNFNKPLGNQQALFVYETQAIDANKLLPTIKPLVANTGYINVLANSNKLLIADAYDNIKRLASLIKQLDQIDNIQIQTIKLEYASANTVAAVINSLLSSDNNLSFTMTSDERSNSVLMSGDKITEKKVKQLIQHLDRPISTTDNTRVIFLRYSEATEILPILQSMSKAIQQENKNQDIVQQAINIEASSHSNALVITAPPDILQTMEKVIAQIDIRRAQVLVETIIVEINEDLARQLGVEWNTSFNAQTGTEGATQFGLRQTGTLAVENILSAGLSLGYYSGGSLRGLINALATEVGANILSTPSLMTLDNQEAEILVGSNVPIITGQSLTNNSENPFTTIERQDIGISLKVTPQINDKNSVTLDILQELETLSDSTTSSTDLVTNKRSIKTKVLVENNKILVLGGLISDEEREKVSKVPFLGDIPLLGKLFQSSSKTKVKRNLMVFIHPIIISNDEDGTTLSSAKYQKLKTLKKQFSNP